MPASPSSRRRSRGWTGNRTPARPPIVLLPIPLPEGASSPLTPAATGPTLTIPVKPTIPPSLLSLKPPLVARTVSFISLPKDAAMDNAFSTPSSARAVPARPLDTTSAAPNTSPRPHALFIAVLFMHARQRNRHAGPRQSREEPRAGHFAAPCRPPRPNRRPLSDPEQPRRRGVRFRANQRSRCARRRPPSLAPPRFAAGSQ